MSTHCAPLVADLFFCSVMRETSCCLFQMISPFFFLFKSQPPRSGLLVSRGRMDIMWANAPGLGGLLLMFSTGVRIPLADVCF